MNMAAAAAPVGDLDRGRGCHARCLPPGGRVLERGRGSSALETDDHHVGLVAEPLDVDARTGSIAARCLLQRFLVGALRRAGTVA